VNLLLWILLGLGVIASLGLATTFRRRRHTYNSRLVSLETELADIRRTIETAQRIAQIGQATRQAIHERARFLDNERLHPRSYSDWLKSQP
jgi:hypothetical protein